MKWNTDRLSYAMVSGLLLSTSAWLAGGIAAQAQVTPDGTMSTSICDILPTLMLTHRARASQ